MSTTLKEKKYTESQKVKDAFENYTNYKDSAKPSDYVFSDQEALSQTEDKYLKTKDFSYDVHSDPLYNQYKQTYTSQGKKAMEDSIGTASALSGGYSNSYAQTAGMNAYYNEMDKLNDVIPELYSAAYSRYEADLDRISDQLSYLTAKDKSEYGKYIDSYNFYVDEVNALRDLYLEEYANDIDIQDSEWEAAYKIAMKEQEKLIADAEIGYKYYAANQNQAQFDAEMAYKQALADNEDKYRQQELWLDRKEIENKNSQFWATFDESNKETLREDEIYSILGSQGEYEALAAIDLNYEDDEMVRYKAMSMGIPEEYIDAYFEAKYPRG